MEPDFQKALFIVLGAGTLIGGIATLVLFLAFRGAQKQGKAMPMGLIVGLVTFVFVCCLLLFALAYSER